MIEWQNNFEAVMTDRSALSDTYIKISPVPRVSEGRLVLEDNSTSNYEIIHYTSKDAGGVYTTDGGARNEDGNSNGIHAKGARVRMNLTAQDMQDIKDIATGSVVADGSVTNAKLSTTVGDIGGAWKAYNSQPNGWGTVDGGVFYTKIGKTVILAIDIWGTSNSTTTTIALPFTAYTQSLSIVRVKSGASYAPGMALVSGSTCLLYANTTGDGFASSGDKNINGTVIYSTSA